MADGDRSLGQLKRERSPGALHSGRLRKCRIDDCEYPNITPEGATTDDLTVSLNWTDAELRCLILFVVLHTDGKI